MKHQMQKFAMFLDAQYGNCKDDAILQIASLALSYAHTALCKWTTTGELRPTLEEATRDGALLSACWHLAFKFYGNFSSDQVFKLSSELEDTVRTMENYREVELGVLELLDFKLNIVTSHEMVQHLLGTLQPLDPQLSGNIRESTRCATRTLLISADLIAQDAGTQALDCVRGSLARVGMADNSSWSLEFRRLVGSFTPPVR